MESPHFLYLLSMLRLKGDKKKLEEDLFLTQPPQEASKSEKTLQGKYLL